MGMTGVRFPAIGGRASAPVCGDTGHMASTSGGRCMTRSYVDGHRGELNAQLARSGCRWRCRTCTARTGRAYSRAAAGEVYGVVADGPGSVLSQ
eukprot:763340-Hanusia_phi.AAC.12